MSKHRCMFCVLPLALVAGSLFGAAPSSFEQRRAGYAQLVSQMQTYRQHLREARWQTTHTETTEKGDMARWSARQGGLSLVKVDNQQVLQAHGLANRARPFSFKGVEISGDYAIEVEVRGQALNYYHGAKITPPVNEPGQPPALHINLVRFVDGVSTVPFYSGGGFAIHQQQIAAQAVLISDINGPMLAQSENTRQLKKRRTLRMEVRDGVVTHLINGVPYRHQPLPENFDPTKPHHPRLAVSFGSVHIKRLVVQRLRDGVDHDALEAEAWAKAFSDTTRAQAEARAAELVLDLDHNDYRVRETAQVMLAGLAELSGESIKQAAESGSVEQQWRARALLGGASTSSTPMPTSQVGYTIGVCGNGW